MQQTSNTPTGWLILVYRVPPEPSSNRVSIWRDLKRIGALYLQQCVCVVPALPHLRQAIADVREKTAKLNGSSNCFEVLQVAIEEEAALIAGFRELAAKQYAEIVEECETKFVKEIEFERFRENFSFAEAEEIEQDLEKIRRWFAQVQQRDWYGAEGRLAVEDWIARCADMLEEFYAEVHARAAREPSGPDASEMVREVPRLAALPSLNTGPSEGQPRTAKRRKR